MRAMKRTVSVLLSLMLVLGMMAIGMSAVGAAGTNTITAKSTITSDASQTYTSDSKQVTVTYYFQSAKKLINAEGVLTYDPAVLKPAATTTEQSLVPYLRNITVNLGLSGGRITFNASDPTNPVDFTTKDVFLTITFDIIGTGDTTVNMDIDTITVTNTDGKTRAGDLDVVYDGVVDNTLFTADATVQVTPEEGLVAFSNFLDKYRSTLDGKVSLAYMFYKTPKGNFDPSTLSVKFSGPEELTDMNKTIPYTQLHSYSTSRYRHEYQMYSAMFSQPITCEILQNGKVIARETYSIEKYVLDNIGSANEKLATLYKALLNFGAKAQVQFNKFTDAPADRGIDYTMPLITANDIVLPSGVGTKPDLSAIGLNFYKESGSYLAATDLKVVYKVTDSTKFKNASVAVDGTATTMTNYNTAGTYKQVTVDTIASPLLDKVFEIQFKNGSTTVGTYKTSILAQLKSKLAEEPDNQFYMAVYWYNQAANDYFGL